MDQAPIDPAAAGFDEAAIKDRRRRAVIGIAVAVFVLLLVLFMTWKFLQRPVQTVDAGTESASIADNSSAIATDSGLSTVPPETATATEAVVPSEPTGSDTTIYQDPGAVVAGTPESAPAKVDAGGSSTTNNPAPHTNTTPKTTPAPAPVTTKAAVSYPNTVLALSPSSPNGAHTWYKSRPLVRFTPTGRRTYYRWKTWGSWTRYKAAIYAPDGKHTLQFYSYKPDGKRQGITSKEIKVDRTKPSIPGSLRVISNVNGSAVVAWNKSTDSYSGVASYEILDSKGTKRATSTGLSATISGLTPAVPYTFTVRAIDVAGNKSANSNSISLAPSTVVLTTPPNPDGANGWFRTPPTISLVSNESGTSYYAWDAQVGYTTYSDPFTLSIPGAHSLRYYSQNSDGQAETEKSAPIKLDSLAPPSPSAPSVVASGTDTVHLSWDAVTDLTPGSGLDHYVVMDIADTGQVKTSYMVTPSGDAVQTFTVTDPTGFTGRYFQVVAVDAAGNQSSSGRVAAPAAVTPSSARAKVGSLKGSFGRVAFDDPTPGLISVPITDPPPPPPGGYIAIPGTFFDVTPSGPFSGTATVVLNYNPANLTDPSAQIRMMHYTSGHWVDITTEVDTVGHRVSGVTSSFSPFGLFEDPPSVSTPASSWESLLGLGAFGLLLAVWSLRRRAVGASA